MHCYESIFETNMLMLSVILCPGMSPPGIDHRSGLGMVDVMASESARRFNSMTRRGLDVAAPIEHE